MTGDELITYGFKRILEEMEKQTKVLKQIEEHIFTGNSILVASEADLKVLRDTVQITEVAVLDMKRLIAEGQHDRTESN